MSARAGATSPTLMAGWRRAILWLVIAAGLVWTILTAVLIPEQPNMPLVLMPVLVLMLVSFGGVGALVVSRRPRNPVGWILWAMATVIVVSTIPQPYVAYSLTKFGGTLPGTVALAWLSNLGFVPALLIVVLFVPLLLPDGRLLSPRWRWLAGFNIVATLAVLLPAALKPGPLSSFDGSLGLPVVANPLGVPDLEILGRASGFLLGPTLLVALPLTIAASVLRFRRGSPTERAQIKWFAAAVAFTAICFLLSFPGSPLSEIGWYLAILSFALIPVAIGVAILRYRLYDIDVIINRALVYGPLTAMVAGFYAASVALTGRLLADAGMSSDAGVVLTTLVVVALFSPVKSAVQSTVDRRFKVTPRAPVLALAAPTDLTALVMELGKLRDAGLLTPAEFDAKKLDLLARL